MLLDTSNTPVVFVTVEPEAMSFPPFRSTSRLCEENPHNFTGLDLETVVQGTTTEEQTVHTALDGAYLDGSYYELQRGTERAARLDWGAPAEDVQDALNTLTLTDARVDIIPVGVNPSFQPDYIIRSSAQASRDRFVDPGTLLRGLGAAGAGNVATLAVVDIGNRGAAHHALLGSYDGYTYPPGAGNLDSITYDTSSLQGTTPAVVNEVLRTGSTPFSGTFSVAFNGAKTEEMEWQEAADEVEYVIEKLDTIGEIRVDRTDMGLQRIPGSPGKNDKSFYFVENVHTDDPVFVDDAAFVVSPDLFSSSLGDVVPIVERDGAASVVDDGEDYRTYLVGLGRAFEAYAVLADAMRVPERALTYVACEDLRRRRLDDGAATTFLYYQVTLDASYNGDDAAVRSALVDGDEAALSAALEGDILVLSEDDHFEVAVEATAADLDASGDIGADTYAFVRNHSWYVTCSVIADDVEIGAGAAPKEAEAPVSALFEKLPPTPTPERETFLVDVPSPTIYVNKSNCSARPFGDNHDEYVVAEIIFAATAEQAPLAPYRCNVACSILDGNQPGGSTKLEYE
ncbi:hypothetical protein AURANDRAFT_62171 [Aureococcus anophagefferens]|uniref:Uncharacterized protein n=1 Tax=Aureococcus anophagefferens TaxID=44056 RepID=F0Y2L3_AURAN|nr:hypothetical protein AURANDRAFT_62171 [Aureococcus anophagefferens]EGB11050.1 hypothetical protein AURANDRAFT_62171 [Aureococcus anophagefferens]|eukprot:XP_009034605.1 hypothetical protein AURANDRAFT_62171 [Aureococcus anophagefferens]